MKTFKWISLAAALLAGLLSLPASAQKIETDYDHSINFSQYHTYSWGRVHTSDPFFEQRVRDAVNRDLQAKGWQLVPSGGDVTLTAVAIKRDRAEYDTFYEGFGPGWRWHGWGSGMTMTTVETVPVGTLVLDIYDSGSHHLVWRGMAYDTLSSKPDKNAQKLDKSVDKMFSKFPPR